MLTNLRRESSERTGTPFDPWTIQAVWEKGSIVAGVDARFFRKDGCGAWIERNSYGDTTRTERVGRSTTFFRFRRAGRTIFRIFSRCSGRTTGQKAKASSTVAVPYWQSDKKGIERWRTQSSTR
jgi:hypothetical protein